MVSDINRGGGCRYFDAKGEVKLTADRWMILTAKDLPIANLNPKPRRRSYVRKTTTDRLRAEAAEKRAAARAFFGL